jgi:hypothetical protein
VSEGEDGRRLRVLVITNHLKWFAGSEIVALQAAHGFAAFGDEVTLAANVIGAPLSEHVFNIRLTDAVSELDLAAFDVVWCQHDMLSLLPIATFERASAEGVPHIAYVSLSPFEPHEHVNGVLATALSGDVFANSAETADAVAAANRGVIERAAIHVFHNAAPPEFWRGASDHEPPVPLRSILFVSNHAPPEIDACAALLAARPDCVMSTAAHAIHDVADYTNPNVVKVVLDAQARALIFSRAPLPWWRDGSARTPGSPAPPHDPPALRHVGLYAYRAAFLRRYPTLPMAPLERTEALEQLRVLWHGERIAVHVTDQAPGPGVDTPQDLERVRKLYGQPR